MSEEKRAGMTERQLNFIKRLMDRDGAEEIIRRYGELSEMTKEKASSLIGELMLLPEKKGAKEVEAGKAKAGEEGESTEIVPAPQIVAPVVDEKRAIEHFRRFQRLKKSVLTDNDFLFIGKDGKPTKKEMAASEYISKSGWRKIALIFNLSVEITGKERFEGEDKDGRFYGWIYRVRAIAPNGRFQDAEGVCTSRNAFFCKRWRDKDKGEYEWVDTDEKNIMHTAQTCAFNRAISDIVGSGELSAEEISEEKEQ